MINFKALVFATILTLMTVPLSTSALSQEVAPVDSITIQDVITDQLSAFRTQDHNRAYSHAAPSVKKIFPDIGRFVGMVKNGYSPIYSSTGHNFARSRVIAGQVYQETIITDQTGKTWQAVYSLRKMPDGSWKITGVKLEPYTGAST